MTNTFLSIRLLSEGGAWGLHQCSASMSTWQLPQSLGGTELGGSVQGCFGAAHMVLPGFAICQEADLNLVACSGQRERCLGISYLSDQWFLFYSLKPRLRSKMETPQLYKNTLLSCFLGHGVGLSWHACIPLLWGLLGSKSRYTDINGPGKTSFKQCLIHEKPGCAPNRGEAEGPFCLSLLCSDPTSSQLFLHMVQSSCLGVEALRENKIGTSAPQVHTLGPLWGTVKSPGCFLNTPLDMLTPLIWVGLGAGIFLGTSRSP